MTDSCAYLEGREALVLSRARSLIVHSESIVPANVDPASRGASAMPEIVESLHDLTELVHRQEALLQTSRNERDFYQGLFRHDTRSLVVTTSRGVIREVSDSAAKLLRVPRKFLEDRALIGFVARGACREFRELLGTAVGARRSAELTLRLRNGGGMLPVQAHVSANEAASVVLWEFEPSVQRRDVNERGG